MVSYTKIIRAADLGPFVGKIQGIFRQQQKSSGVRRMIFFRLSKSLAEFTSAEFKPFAEKTKLFRQR
ncbi:MAG TPA: hypothetical protein DIT21_07330 [Oscillibacter sp.]|nr:hypothetical protein [Oscillibacter sp.]